MAETLEKITYGPLDGSFVQFEGVRAFYPEQSQSLPSIGVGASLQRIARQGQQPAFLADWSGGLVPNPGIVDWTQGINLVYFNEGLQTRLGTAVLPYAITNQSSVTSDEDINGDVDDNKRTFEVATSLGDTEVRHYRAHGHIVYRNKGSGDSEEEVCFTTTDVITGMCLHNVNGSEKLCIYTSGATNDIEYVADPTGTWSGNMTTLVALSSGDYVIPLGKGYFPTLGTGVNAMQGTIGGVSGIWWQDTTTAAAWTMRPLVLKDGKDELGNATAVTTSAKQAGNGTFAARSGDTTLPEFQQTLGATAASWWGGWQTASNITASDDAYATAQSNFKVFIGADGGNIAANEGILSDEIWATEYDFTDVPLAAIITGWQADAEVKEADAGDNISWALAQFAINGSRGGINLADGTELPTTEASKTFGGSTVRAIDGITGADVQYGLSFVMQFRADEGASRSSTGSTVNTGTVSIDACPVTLTYKETGTMISLTDGSRAVSHNPVYPHRATLVSPVSTDKTSILQPREMWFIDLEWDGTAERPVMTLSQPNEGVPYVWDCEPAMGGWAIAGGQKAADRGLVLKHLDSDGQTLRDFAFPGVHGTTDVRIHCIYSIGTWLLLGVMNADFSDYQWWWWNSSKYYPDFLLQSKSSLGIADEPMPIGSRALNSQDSRIYVMYPNAAHTHSVVSRCFYPPDPAADYRVANTSEVRSMAYTSGTEDTALHLIGLEQNFGPEEANKALVSLKFYSRRVSAASGGSYGSVTYDFVTDGSTGFGTPAVTKEFTSFGAEYDVPSSGVSYQTLRPRLGLKHDAGSAESPDGGPCLVTTIQQWPHLVTIWIQCAMKVTDYHTFISDLYAVSNTKVTNPLIVGNKAFNAKLVGPPELTSPQSWPLVPPYGRNLTASQFTNANASGSAPIYFLLQFEEAPGSVNAA